MTDADAQPAPPQDRALRWPIFLASLLLLSALAHVALVYQAFNDPGFRAEKDSYQRGLDWDEHKEQLRQNTTLGWQVDLSLRRGADGVAVTLVVRDDQGQPLEGAQARVVAFHNAYARQEQKAALAPTEPGTYAVSLPLRRNGLWTFRCVVERGDDRFTCELSQDLEG